MPTPVSADRTPSSSRVSARTIERVGMDLLSVLAAGRERHTQDHLRLALPDQDTQPQSLRSKRIFHLPAKLRTLDATAPAAPGGSVSPEGHRS